MSSPSESSKPARNAPLWIKAFVVLHLVTITMWTLPQPKRPYMLGTAKFGIDTSSPKAFSQSFSNTITQGFLYLNWRYLKPSPLIYYAGPLGFWQYWDMFAPNPASIDYYLTAEVVYQNGKVEPFKYPRVYDFPVLVRYLKERYRKYFENANQDDKAYMRPYLAQRIALLCYRDPNNPPVQVKLTRHFLVIKPPGEPPNKEYATYQFFVYQVDQEKLRRDKGFKR